MITIKYKWYDSRTCDLSLFVIAYHNCFSVFCLKLLQPNLIYSTKTGRTKINCKNLGLLWCLCVFAFVPRV